ncbi:MAG: hypothetical protein IT364_05560 [Candidatus Hydrogenedentes bacterium]|nr:hypothetical protein [Candidatus Hydrogenedentota bacterium]
MKHTAILALLPIAFLFAPVHVDAQEAALPGGPAVKGVTLCPPDDTTRFYHARVTLAPSEFAYAITETLVGDRPDVFVARVNGELTQTQPNGRVERHDNGRIPAGVEADFLVRCPWEAGKSYTIALRGAKQEGDSPFTLHADVQSPATAAGFPFPGWAEHRVLVLRDDYGIARKDSPYVIFVSDEANRVASWTKELRVAAYDLATGATREIPSQVLYEKRRFDTPVHEKTYTTCEAAFLVDVPAKGKSYYILAYGNPSAEAPSYETDLKLAQRDDGATWIENEFFEAQLDPHNQSLNGFRSKTFGTGDKRTFGLPEQPGYTLHYNPDVWVKNRSWTHTKGWNPPPHRVMQQGPVAVVWRRWGHLPESNEVEVNVTYHFFNKTPYVLVESTIDILEDVVVNALRNEEIVYMPSTEVDHAGYRRANGEVVYRPVEQGKGLTPGIVDIIAAEAPYVCLTREANQMGLASIRLKQLAGTRGAWAPVLASTGTIIADYGWNFRYWSRSLVYPWGDYVPDHPVVLNTDTYYGEKSAFCVFPLGEGETPESRLEYVDALYQELSQPIAIDHQGAGPW